MTSDTQAGAGSAPTRLGFLIPQLNVMCESEFPRRVPEGVSCHFTRLPRRGSQMQGDDLVGMMLNAPDHAELLKRIDVRVIMCACTSGTFFGDTPQVDELAHRVADRTGIPSFTTSRAVVDALAAVKARSVYMLTPYPLDIADQEIRFLDHYGFRVSASYSFECAESRQVRELGSDRVRRALLEDRAAVEQADAVFLSCTNMQTMDVLTELEEVFDRPVISSNSATLWRAMAAAGCNFEEVQCGRLFRLPHEEN